MTKNYSDLDSCVESLKSCGASFYVKEVTLICHDGSMKQGFKIVCYSPYVTYDYKTNKTNVHCYVYNWKDYYDIDGKFITHISFEGLYLSELDETI